jgi:hypothetical protein
MFVCTGSPVTAFADAFKAALEDDATLMALITGVFGSVSQAARTAHPYLVIGRTSDDGATGAMQTPGGMVTLHLDGWSDAKGPYAMERILSRVKAVMERRAPFLVSGFDALRGSLHCELSDVFDEDDTDTPDAILWHGVQRWTCEIHER